MELAAATTSDDVVEPWHLPSAIAAAGSTGGASEQTGFRDIADEIAELEARRMREALEACDGNQSRAAELIRMPRRTFLTKMARYGIS